MQDEEIRRKIASFPSWHYQFNLKGNLTPTRHERLVNRHRQRKKYFFDPLVQLLGGSLAGKRVLDLGCNAGFWSLCAAEAGCDYILGIDGRQTLLDQANFVFEASDIQTDRYDFVTGNLFDIDFNQFRSFDIVLCLGLMYHTSKHIELMEKISEVNSDLLVIDTTLSMLPGSCLELQHDRDLEKPTAAVDYELVMHPTWEAVHEIVHQFGYSVVTLKPDFEDYEGAFDYQGGKRRVFFCAKKTDISRVSGEVEQAPPGTPPESVRRRKGIGRAGGRRDRPESARTRETRPD